MAEWSRGASANGLDKNQLVVQICTAIAMRTAVPIDLYCYADIDYTVIAVCGNVLYKTHLIAYDGYWVLTYNIVIKIKYVSVYTV